MGLAGAACATDTLLGLVERLPTDDCERDLLATSEPCGTMESVQTPSIESALTAG